ncbi:MAG: MBL fold hydrolase [Nitrospirae bacterium GWC2_42_7]|nr:MAG: MBL fold hydrolase [Nitrospirae bacterium GWC2_42_7]
MKLRFLGGARTVTGTCFYLVRGKNKILVDCGMYQGPNAAEVNRNKFEFDPSEIDCLFLTHSHLDHVGLVPKLIREGFTGKIITTSAAADITELILYDAAHIQETDTEWHNRKALRSGSPIIEPLYTRRDVDNVLPLIERKNYGKIEKLCEGIRYRFVDAGHILGSSSLELWYIDGTGEKKIVFSGDIGKKENPIVHDPVFVEETDYLTIESTYGNRNHKGMEASIDELVEVIKSTFKKGGNVIIPSFALGRTQDLLYILNKLVKEDRLFRINVYIDSPLAERITKVYAAHPEYFEAGAKELFNLESRDALRLHFTRRIDDSIALNRIKREAIIIASSGMCEGGRVKHHLKHNLWRKESSIVFVGFQAHGTLGREIVDGKKIVEVLGEDIVVRAGIHTLGGFSAHADKDELMEWISMFKNSPEIFVVHGEEKASLDFQALVNERFGYKTHVPEKGQEFEI